MEISTLLQRRSLLEEQIVLMVDPYFLPVVRGKLADFEDTILQIEREMDSLKSALKV